MGLLSAPVLPTRHLACPPKPSTGTSTVPCAWAHRELSDGGGPFGFDITTALEFDFLIDRYGCDAVIETGCNMGDTTEYLARTYPTLTIVTCDIVDRYVEMTRHRVGFMPHTHVEKVDSPDVLARWKDQFVCPLF